MTVRSAYGKSLHAVFTGDAADIARGEGWISEEIDLRRSFVEKTQ